METLKKTWRWFGVDDPIKLNDLKQLQVEGIVTTLHHINAGKTWPLDEIKKLKRSIEHYGLEWSVVESLPVAEGIKTHSKNYDQLTDNYIQSLKHLAHCGINTVCYNFMPVLDWARTDLHYKLPTGGEVMCFDFIQFAAFDIHILKRPSAESSYDPEVCALAKETARKMTADEKEQLAYNIIVYTQGFIHGNISDEKNYKSAFLDLLAVYQDIDKAKLRQNLYYFLADVLPYAEKWGIKLAIHPDDPPFSLLGLPRIISTQEDLDWLFRSKPSKANGLCFCSGSLAASDKHELDDIMSLFAERIYFAHLRNNKRLGYRHFHEIGHLDGDINMAKLMLKLLQEQQRRQQTESNNYKIPVRPDHGVKLLHDFDNNYHPGYPLIGRLKGLAEISGLEKGILHKLK